MRHKTDLSTVTTKNDRTTPPFGIRILKSQLKFIEDLGVDRAQFIRDCIQARINSKVGAK